MSITASAAAPLEPFLEPAANEVRFCAAPIKDSTCRVEPPLVGAALGSGLNTAPTFTDPTVRDKDYALSPNHVTHDFRSYGVFQLPFGPGRLLFRNTSGILARVIEGWQTSFIVNASAGQPATVSATY